MLLADGGGATAFILHYPRSLFSCKTRMSNIYIYKAADGAGIAGGHALGPEEGLRLCPLAVLVCSWSQLPQEVDGGVVPSAVLRKEV